MCNAKPGLRCATHAKERIESLQNQLDNTSPGVFSAKKKEQYFDTKAKLKEAQLEYSLTNQGLKEKEDAGEDVEHLKRIRENRQNAQSQFEATYGSKMIDGEHETSDLSVSELEQDLNQRRAINEHVTDSMMYQLNHSPNSDYTEFMGLVDKAATTKARVDNLENELEHKTKIGNKLEQPYNNRAHHTADFLDEERILQDDYTNQTLQASKIIANLKVDGNFINKDDFSGMTNTNEQVLVAMIFGDAASMKRRTKSFDVENSANTRASLIVRHTKLYGALRESGIVSLDQAIENHNRMQRKYLTLE